MWARYRPVKSSRTGKSVLMQPRPTPQASPCKKGCADPLSRQDIVLVDLWTRVQARFAEPSRRKQSKTAKARRGRPPSHLLSGLLVCDSCGANMVIESRGRYACSSRTNGGRSLCVNNLRVDGDVAEAAILSGVKHQLLSDAAIEQMQKQVRKKLREITRKAPVPPGPSGDALRSELRKVEAKLERIADAIETTGISGILIDRLKALETQKQELSSALKNSKKRKPAGHNLPDIIPGIVKRYRKMVGELAQLGKRPLATPDDVQNARKALLDLFGTIRVEPRGDVLVARIATTGAGLVKASPASINSAFVVAGAGFEIWLREPDEPRRIRLVA